MEKITADRPSDEEPFAPEYWTVSPGEGGVWGIAATSEAILVEGEGADGETILERFDHDGRSLDTTLFEHERDQPRHNNGSPAVSPDGAVYAIDTYDGRRQVAQLDADGSTSSSFEVPPGAESTGHPLDLKGIHWVADLGGAPALLIGEGERTVHGFRENGDYLGVLPGLPDTLLGSVGNTSVAGLTVDGGTAHLRVHDLATGATVLHVPFSLADREFAVSGPPRIERPRGVTPGPRGEGFLVASADGIQWVDAHGVRQGFWMNGSGGMTLAEAGRLIERDGHYWVLSFLEGEYRVLSLSSEEMQAMLLGPVEPKASREASLARLGIGIGPTTDRPFNHFDAGEVPEVFIETEEGWGVSDAGNSELQLHYTVTGDPTLAEPVVQEQRRAEIPLGGGRSALELPERRPGVYEVSLWLVEPGSTEPLSGACLRYSISPEASPLRLGTLSDGADWGGPGPLRGVEIAARLGIGSHRVQLDFASLVPDPAAEPSPSGIRWQGLPGAGEEDDDAGAFGQLRAAAQVATQEGVDLIVQLGQNGEAERAAVDSGTWEGWSEYIVAGVAEQVPEIILWSPWNEPNMAFDDGAEYAEDVEIPFALAAHRANPGAQVLAGNSLGFAFDWWRSAATTNLCEHVDAIAVHPYTGWNRSWEEEGFIQEGSGFDELRDALGPECAALPVWDTETGWTSDGALSLWSQGANVARKLLWYTREDLAGWTYFFSEGGWGEFNLSWSLIQHQSYVKPGALAFATTSRLLADSGAPEVVETPIPFSHAMRLGGAVETVAIWTDGMRLEAVARTDAAELTVIDHYGHERSLPVEDGRVTVTLTGAPQFFVASAGTIEFQPVEEFGPDVLVGAEVQPSSTHEEADPQVITSGTVNPHRPWRSGRVGGAVDPSPHVDIALEEPTVIDRVAVASGSIVCCEAGLRDYTVSVQTPDEQWVEVAQVEDQFWDRVVLVEFDPVEAVSIRIEVPWRTIRGVEMLSVNYTDLAGGHPPPFMGLQTESDYVVSIAAVSAWEPAR
ncbi:hypothetical protein [Pseudactinotalea sp. Z1732]|uniref:hypothetical protein n=1 Tax=Micrococcales TaxID=85006 RepID=UPI003C7BAC60